MRIIKEKAGIIGPTECWICLYDSYIHIEDTLPKLLWNVLKEFRNDKHFVG